jgi:hypothetical protein
VIVRYYRLLGAGFGLLAAVLGLSAPMACADEPIPQSTTGAQTVGLAVGPIFPIRVMPGQSSKLFGTAVIPSWSMTITGPIGSSWSDVDGSRWSGTESSRESLTLSAGAGLEVHGSSLPNER